MSCSIDFVNNWRLGYQGAESRLYFGLHSNTRSVIKHRFSKAYRHPTLDARLTKERTKRERRMIERIHEKSKILSPYMPRVVWSNSDTILMTEVLDCETVFDYINAQSGDISNIANLIGECVAELHSIGIIHGDLTTSNLLLLSQKEKVSDNNHIIIPIDFGLSTGSEHPEERAVDLYVLERALLSAHFSDSKFFDSVLEVYLERLATKTQDMSAAKKIVEKLKDVRLRGRKSDYASI